MNDEDFHRPVQDLVVDFKALLEIVCVVEDGVQVICLLQFREEESHDLGCCEDVFIVKVN